VRTSDRSGLVENVEANTRADSARAPLDRLAERESGLWRVVLVLLVILAMGVAAISWPGIQTIPWKLDALPIGLVLIISLFAAYAWSKRQEMAELRWRVSSLESRSPAQPNFEKTDQLFQMVQRSQQGYRDLIDTFDDLLFSASLDGRILAANRSFADLFGRAFPEIVGRRLDEFVDLPVGDGRAAALQALPRLLETRRWSGVLRVTMKHDASTRYFRCSVQTLSRDRQDHGLCVLARDITKEREDEARFTELFETLQAGVYLASAEGKLENVNPALVRMLGYEDSEELLGRSLSDFLIENGRQESGLPQGTTDQDAGGREAMFRRRDGSTVSCLHASALVRDPAGKVCRQQGSLIDITERCEIEKRLYREQQFARRLVESFPDLVLAVDREGRYTFVSPRAKELLGVPPEELLGRSLTEQIDFQDRKEVRALLDSIVSGQSPNTVVEYRVERRDGEVRLFRATASPLFDSDGRIEGVIASARDITDSKRSEQQFIQTERLAAMGQMIAGVAHELNNPLTAVLGVTELLRDSATEDSARRQLEIAHRQARRAAQIVQSVLTFSRPPQPRKTCVNLGELIQRSLSLHEHSLRSNSITAEFTAKPDLPLVLADVSQLTQVFLNLIANAEQAIGEIRPYGTIRIRVASLGDRVLATFQDDGVGIRREILPRIFDPFFTTKRPGRGTGLGLSICMAILREHGGQIEAQPLADGGSVFTVSLPTATGTSTFLVEPVSKAAEIPAPAADRISGSSVLVVDDEESMRELVREGLSLRGLRVDVAATGEEALSLMNRRRYDAVICDLNLRGNGAGPALSGRQLYAQVGNASSSDPSEKPFFVFMTGELLDQAEDLLKQGASLLQKPFRISELLSLLAEVLPKAAPDAEPTSKVN